MNISDLEMGSPKLGDTLFVSTNPAVEPIYAIINKTKGINNEYTQFYIIEGYRECLKMLLNGITNNKDRDNLKIDCQIYPILYTFRHYLEIILKDTLRYYKILNDEVKSDEIGYKKGHHLFEIWENLKPYLLNDSIHCSEESKIEEAVEKIILEMDGVDKDSFGFRYAFKGEKDEKNKVRYSIPNGMTIEIKNLQEVIVRTINYFEGINWKVTDLLDQKQSNSENE